MILTARRSLVSKMSRNQAPRLELFFLNINVRRSHLVMESLNEVRSWISRNLRIKIPVLNTTIWLSALKQPALFIREPGNLCTCGCHLETFYNEWKKQALSEFDWLARCYVSVIPTDALCRYRSSNGISRRSLESVSLVSRAWTWAVWPKNGSSSSYGKSFSPITGTLFQINITDAFFSKSDWNHWAACSSTTRIRAVTGSVHRRRIIWKNTIWSEYLWDWLSITGICCPCTSVTIQSACDRSIRLTFRTAICQKRPMNSWTHSAANSFPRHSAVQCLT